MSDSMSMKRLSRWALGLLALGVGCDPVVEPQQGLAREEATAQVQQASTINWPSNLTVTGDLCRFGDTSQGHQVATNTRASGRLEESFTITGLAGRRITSLRLNGSSTTFKYDDVMLLAYNNHLLMASDQRVAQYSASPASLGTSPVLYSWSKVLNGLIDNQNIQSAWCSSGATTCVVPRTETTGSMDVNIPSFTAVDQAAYPSAPDSRAFRLVTIGDNDASIDCRHGPVSLTVTVTSEPLLSCSAIKAANPSAPDGVYWISTPNGPVRVYCDMQQNRELCREGVAQDVTTRTREGSNLDVSMRTILLPSRNTCEIWNLRRTSDGLPLSQLHPVAGNTLSTCQALGFQRDGKIGRCPYGNLYGDCGFTSAQYYVYGNSCSGCSVNNGSYNDYIRQGLIGTGTVITDVSGSIRTSCTVATTACDQDPASCGTSSSRPASGCAHLRVANPSASNGIYWVDSAQGAVQTYCKDGYELCSTVEGESVGIAPFSVTGASNMFYRMRSRLDATAGTCAMWGIRHAGDGLPLAPLFLVGGNTLSACQALGFFGDSQVGSCRFGSSNTDCGFSSPQFYLYGNSCSGCVVGDGSYGGYVQQGPIANGTLLSNMSGTIRTTCRAR